MPSPYPTGRYDKASSPLAPPVTCRHKVVRLRGQGGSARARRATERRGDVSPRMSG